MLAYKTWLDTRWRFLIGLGLLTLLAFGTAFEYPAVMRLMPLADKVDASSSIGRAIREAADLQRTFRGFVWYQWVRQNLTQLWTLFAVLLGSGGLLAHASSGATQFTLTLPVSRTEVFGTRVMVGLGELLALAIVPFLLIPLCAPAVGQSYRVVDALIHGACMFAGGSVFFCLALFLSTVFSDLWRPLLITCAIAVALGVADQLIGAGIFHVMTAESYLRANAVPWTGLLASATVSAALLYGAMANFARQDF